MELDHVVNTVLGYNDQMELYGNHRILTVLYYINGGETWFPLAWVTKDVTSSLAAITPPQTRQEALDLAEVLEHAAANLGKNRRISRKPLGNYRKRMPSQCLLDNNYFKMLLLTSV
jgi:hypothetical protein